jgi:peptidyl-prolyl cis-trans isomerase D
MLASFRKLSDSFITKAILLLIVASFAFWGIGDMVNGGKRIDLVKIGDETISADEYFNELQKLKANLGEFFSSDIVLKLNLFELTLQELIAKKLFAIEAKSLNIAISDKLVKQIISQDEAFQNESGLFDAAIFNRKLKQMRINESQLVETMREIAAEEILKKSVVAPANFSKKYYELLFNAEYQKRKLLYFTINNAQIKNISPPTEDELKGYYEANMVKYNAPEYRRFEYILLDKNAVNANIKISEDELRTHYMKKQKQFMTPEKRHIWHLLYDEKESAEQAYSMLRNNTDFEAVAQRIPPVNNGNMELGFLAKHQFTINAPDVFNLAKSDFTSPIKTDFGWHIFQVRKIKPAFVPAFEDLREQLKSDLLQDSRAKQLQRMLEKVEDDISAGLTLEVIAKNSNLTLHQSELLDDAGRKSDNTQDFDLAIYKPMLKFAFANDINKMSQLITLGNGSSVVVNVKEISESRPRILEEVRGLIMRDLEAQKRKEAQTLLADNIAAQIRNNAKNTSEIKNILEENNLDFALISVSRDGVVQQNDTKTKAQQLDKAIIEGLFSRKKPLDVLDYVTQGDKLIGGVFIEAIQPDKSEYLNKYDDFKLRLEKNYQNEILAQYLIALQQKYPIIKDVEMIESINKRF